MEAILGALLLEAKQNDRSSIDSHTNDDSDDRLDDYCSSDSYMHDGRLAPQEAITVMARFMLQIEKTSKRKDTFDTEHASSDNKYTSNVNSVKSKEAESSLPITSRRTCTHPVALLYPRRGPGNPCPVCYRLETNPKQEPKHTTVGNQINLPNTGQENILNNIRRKELQRHKKIKNGLRVVAGVFFPVTLLYLLLRTRDPYNTKNNQGDLEALTKTTEKVLIKMRILKKLRRPQ